MRFSELDGKRVGVWGLGRETRSLARQLTERLPRARLAVVVREDPSEKATESDWAGATVVGPDDAVAALAACDVLVRSPGVSIHKPELCELAASGLETTTATALWVSERGGRGVIAVTGTKGKSTTAALLAHLLASERVTHLAGNIGRPALDLLDVPAAEWVVLELSSYQIADLRQGPEVAVITNLYREHIPWHRSEEAYRREKLRLFSLPGVVACAYPPRFAEVEAAVAGCPRRVPFGVESGWHVAGEGSVVHPDGSLLAASDLPLRGPHNALNLGAALAAIDAAELPRPRLPEALAGVVPLPHRLQTVLDRDGVEWIDDSISTAPESSLAAIAAFPERPVVLIAGGSDRDQDYAELGRAAAERDVVLVVLPVTGSRLAIAARAAGLSEGRIVAADAMEDAVELARRRAVPGAVVLLSPAAPSFNRYRNFEERGDHFAALAGRAR
ncbi:MAG TPA: UDP-N-acetylmuramoyl-L-alanine--D-glutamate ligase [Solirubrobacteraceae bacterium]|nr:UDP-N-acetylmuramoyl-L-alanine--D-glutamate ligase [Solirubrobacteraceae bacterium]